MKTFLLTVAACSCATAALADRIIDGYVGCITEDALDEFISASVANDENQINALLGTTCVPIGGLEYSMVDVGFMTSQVRVYFGSDSVLLYTVAEAAR